MSEQTNKLFDVTTDELLDELRARYDHIVIVGIRKVSTQGGNVDVRIGSTCFFTCEGLINQAGRTVRHELRQMGWK